MAGTKRIQNAINSLKQYPDIAIRVILQRQSSEHNALSGVHEGTPYKTVMGNLFRSKMFILLPVLYYKSIVALKGALRPNKKNIIYFYGPLFLDSIVPLNYAKRIGYKIVFDVIEDYDLSNEVSGSFYHHIRSNAANWFSSRIIDLSSGIIVISSHLEKKYEALTKGEVPIHYMPISVNMDRFPEKPRQSKSTISLLYAGSFSQKDGVHVLLDAFDRLANRFGNVRLILTGSGERKAIKEFFARVEASPYKNRIEFKGYLNDADYYAMLNDVDIPCMSRVDLAFAHAGFPFKLGEFLATGKPVIASRVSDIDRFLVHGHNAMVVQPGLSEEICEAVEFLINNPESAEAIGMKGREVAKLSFDFK